jgi:hypothetical protein
MSANGTLVPMPTAQNGWTIVRSYEEFVGTITKQGLPKFIAFDHDLHFEHMKDYFEVSKIENRIINPLKLNYSKYRHKTGYHCAYWLSEYCKANNLKVPAFVAHSMNHIGARNITTLLGKFSRICSEFNC